MANTVSLLSFTNTFGDMMTRVNSLIKENNDVASNNFIKPTGTLFLNDPSRGLSVSSNASVGGTLTISGVGSALYVQNGLTANTISANTITLTNTTLGQLLVGGGSSGTIKSLANTGTAGVYGKANSVAVITTDGYGRVSGATNTAIAIDASQITTGTLPVARGGTGVTTSTGTGNTVLSTSPTLTTPTISGHLTLEGVTTTGNTGVGKLVFDTNPVLVNPTLGTPLSGNFSTGTFTWPTFNQNTTGTANNITDYSINQNLSISSTPTFDKIYTANNGLGLNLQLGNDAWIGDTNIANAFRITGVEDPTQGYILFGNSDSNTLGRSGTGDLTYTGNFASQGEIRSDYAGNSGQFRAVQGNYGTFFRNDGSNFYILGTNYNDPYGSWNNFRPFVFNLSSGAVTINGNGNGGTAVGGDFSVTGGFNLNGEFNMTDGGNKTRIIDHYGSLFFRYSDNATFFNEILSLNTDGSTTVYGYLNALSPMVSYSGASHNFNNPTNTTAATLRCDHYAPGNFNLFYILFGGTGVYLKEGNTAWTANSDERIKDIIEPITGGLNKVNQLRSVIGKFKHDEEGVRRSFIIAQDVEKVLPEAVSEGQDGILGVQYTDLIPLLISAIKELSSEVEYLKSKIQDR